MSLHHAIVAIALATSTVLHAQGPVESTRTDSVSTTQLHELSSGRIRRARPALVRIDAQTPRERHVVRDAIVGGAIGLVVGAVYGYNSDVACTALAGPPGGPQPRCHDRQERLHLAVHYGAIAAATGAAVGVLVAKFWP
jgi:hypothetical protein